MRIKSDLAGWWTASILFGFSHITNGNFPNWRYVALASIAGFLYGWTWRKTGSILPPPWSTPPWTPSGTFSFEPSSRP